MSYEYWRDVPPGRWHKAENLLCESCNHNLHRRVKKENQSLRRTKKNSEAELLAENIQTVNEDADANRAIKIADPKISTGEFFLANSKLLPSMPKKEALRLLKEIDLKNKRGEDNSKEISEIIKGNIAFVIALAKVFYVKAFGKFDATDDYFTELVSEAAIAMFRRLKDSPEPDNDETIAERVGESVSCVLMRFAIQRKWGNFTKIPNDYAWRYYRYLNCKNELSILLNREPTQNEIISKMIDKNNCSVVQAKRTIEKILPIAESCLYLAMTIYPGSDSTTTFQETLESDTPSPEQIAIDRERYAQLIQAVGKLPEREQTIINLRYGLKDNVFRTLEEVGGELNLTRERIRQIEAVALRKLRHPAFTRGLSQ